MSIKSILPLAATAAVATLALTGCTQNNPSPLAIAVSTSPGRMSVIVTGSPLFATRWRNPSA